MTCKACPEVVQYDCRVGLFTSEQADLSKRFTVGAVGRFFYLGQRVGFFKQGLYLFQIVKARNLDAQVTGSQMPNITDILHQ